MINMEPRSEVFKHPIMRFFNEAEARKCMEEWKELLGLHDWVISVKLQEHVYLDDNDPSTEVAGKNDYEMVHKSACIYISTQEGGQNDRVLKVSQEKTLVHELMHIIITPLFPLSYSFSDKVCEFYFHQWVESLARSFVCLKYDLPFDWWDNTYSGRFCE